MNELEFIRSLSCNYIQTSAPVLRMADQYPLSGRFARLSRLIRQQGGR
ncbi:hypothetical protein [Paenibacillus macerans]|nr:hypothetical protein [Paenibacillus macerans]